MLIHNTKVKASSSYQWGIKRALTPVLQQRHFIRPLLFILASLETILVVLQFHLNIKMYFSFTNGFSYARTNLWWTDVYLSGEELISHSGTEVSPPTGSQQLPPMAPFFPLLWLMSAPLLMRFVFVVICPPPIYHLREVQDFCFFAGSSSRMEEIDPSVFSLF